MWGLLAVALGGDGGAVCDQQTHGTGGHRRLAAGPHRCHGDCPHGDSPHRYGPHGDGPHCDGVGRLTLIGRVRAHVTLQLRGCLTLDPTELTQQDPPSGAPERTPGPTALLPLLTVVLLSVDPQVRQRREAAVAEVAGVVLRLVVDSHVVSDVGGRQQLPTDVTGHLLLMTDQVSAQPVPGGEGRGAGSAFEGPFCRVHLSDMTVQVIRSGEGLGAVRTHVGLLDAALVRADVVAHAVLAFEALLADGAGVGLLVGVRQTVAVQVVHVSEGFTAGLAGMVFTHRS